MDGLCIQYHIARVQRNKTNSWRPRELDIGVLVDVLTTIEHKAEECSATKGQTINEDFGWRCNLGQTTKSELGLCGQCFSTKQELLDHISTAHDVYNAKHEQSPNPKLFSVPISYCSENGGLYQVYHEIDDDTAQYRVSKEKDDFKSLRCIETLRLRLSRRERRKNDLCCRDNVYPRNSDSTKYRKGT